MAERDVRPAADGAMLDDDALGALVRDAAAEWLMPPRRLDQPGWRERSEARLLRRAGRGHTFRTGGAVIAAVLATLVLAVAAGWLGQPRTSPPIAASPVPSVQPRSSAPATGTSESTPAPTPRPTPIATGDPPAGTPLPRAFSDGGSLPELVRLVGAANQYRLLDFEEGRLGPPLADRWSGGAQTGMWRLVDGTYLCACARSGTTYTVDGGYVDEIVLSLRWFGPDGAVLDQAEIARYVSPRGDGPPALQPVSVAARRLPDGRTLLVGWARLDGEQWLSGVDVISIDRRAIVQTLALDPEPAEDAGVPTFVFAPRVSVDPSGRTAVIVMSTRTGDYGIPVVRRSLLDVAGGRLAGQRPFPTPAAFCVGPIEAWGGEDVYAALCPYTAPELWRFAADGAVLDRTRLDLGRGAAFALAVASEIDAERSLFWAWNPFERRLARVDLATGDIAVSEPAPEPQRAGAPGVIARAAQLLATWIAPTASAKIALMPGLAISPDGTRAYALGVDGDPAGGESAGSTGVYVFDTASLEYLANWSPTSDFISIGVSGDGSVVYASGLAGHDADGRPIAGQGASVTVFDADSGAIRAIAGQLDVSVDFAIRGTVP